jgi:hypothetical protein
MDRRYFEGNAFGQDEHENRCMKISRGKNVFLGWVFGFNWQRHIMTLFLSLYGGK